jgi:hypothetical protein
MDRAPVLPLVPPAERISLYRYPRRYEGAAQTLTPPPLPSARFTGSKYYLALDSLFP